MIDAAIVGLGRWGRLLVDSVQGRSGRIRFIAATTRTPETAAGFCREHGIELHPDLESVLGDPAVDAVVLATPHSLHHGQIVAAARAGKHVFSEKPFTLTRDDAETALAAIAEAKLAVGVGHNRRFAPNTAALKAMITSGGLGRTIHIEGNFSADLSTQAGQWRSDPAESPAGGMTSLGIHVIDAFIHLFGPIAEVRAMSRRLTMPFDVDDTTTAIMTFADGRTGTLGTVAATARLWSVRVFGTGGWAELHEQDRLHRMSLEGELETIDYPGFDYPAKATVAAGLEAFADAAEGATPFPIPPGEILHGIAVMEAIFRSAGDGGAPVAVA